MQIISLAVAVAMGIACAAPALLRLVERIVRSLAGLSQRKLICAVMVGGVSLAADCALVLCQGFQQPRVQDEFSYLLAADTFAHGRLTNPTPPFWKHFETPHVLVRPTYMSKYPPGQGMALAFGQVLAGAAIVGVWLSAAAAAMAIYWMLLSFVTPGWALAGGIVAALHPQLLAWGHVYWGGSVAVLGAALVLGAWGRLMRDASAGSAIVLAIGLGILANSRPYEGLIVSLPLLVALLLRVLPGANRWRVLIPLGATLLLVGAWMGYYNFRVTGHALRMPFVEYSQQYDVYPKFWFLPARTPPQYRNDVMRSLHTQWELGDYERMRTVRGVVWIEISRLWQNLEIAAQPLVLVIPLLAAVGLWNRERFGWVWLTIGIFVLGIWAESWFLPHYAAPVVPLALLLMVGGWQWLWSFRRWDVDIGKILIFATFCGFVAGSVGWMAASPVQPPRFGRAELVANYPQLQTGRHLIFVRYLPGHLLDDEWVYNRADLAQADIIWARAMGESDIPVIQYFAGRQVWLLEVGKDQLRLNTYTLTH